MILYWVGALAITVLLYVLLDGFDLGVGILSIFARDESHRQQMMAAISPVWDGNETWLVLTATILFGAFPAVYSTLLSAFYLPMILLLAALILRGVAFEFRHKATAMRGFWDAGFSYGSLVATLIQGITVGALVEGIKMKGGAYTGGPLDWLTPFSVFCGVGLSLGYSLLGATWLAGKARGTLRDQSYQFIPPIMIGVVGFLVAIFVWSLLSELPIMSRWLQRPYLGVFLALGVVAILRLKYATQYKMDAHLFPWSAALFFAAFGTLAASFWPYMVPFEITIGQAAAPPESLSFMFWGAGLVVLPLTLLYTGAVYRIFRGKLEIESGSYH